MNRTIGILAFLLGLALASPALAQGYGVGTCTIGVPISSTACTQVFAAKDVSGGRHYLLLQCQGANNCYCAVNTNGAGTAAAGLSTDGILIGPAGLSWTAGGYTAGPINFPSGDICCRTTAGSSEIVGCDF